MCLLLAEGLLALHPIRQTRPQQKGMQPRKANVTIRCLCWPHRADTGEPALPDMSGHVLHVAGHLSRICLLSNALLQWFCTKGTHAQQR